MGIEKMTFIDIRGGTADLDHVLVTCMHSGMFQPEYAAKLSEYSIGNNALLRNPYGGLLVKLGEMAGQLRIPLEYVDFTGLGSLMVQREEFIDETWQYLDNLGTEYPGYFSRRAKLTEEIDSYNDALETLADIDAPDISFDGLWESQYLKPRFGRILTANLNKLPGQVDAERPYQLFKLGAGATYTWVLYFTTDQFKEAVDALFAEQKFERLRIPDYVHGNSKEAIASIQESLKSEIVQLEQTDRDLLDFVSRERSHFLRIYSKVKFLSDSYDLRKYAVSIRGQFHVVGYVLQKEAAAFLELFHDLTDIVIETTAADDSRIPPPVRLKNNWFVRPFEMFVNMYGSPTYGDIDPTPFVAYTYCLLFGIMFGDMGHGLCVAVLGHLLWRFKQMDLGRIMTRIGITSMFFGFAYGSVFGFEHLLDPVFHAMGFAEKPIEVMHPETTSMMLVFAVGIGAALILSVIVFNMLMGLKRRDWERVFLSNNGLCGFVFYAGALVAVVLTLAGRHVLNAPYILLCFVLPLTLIFFKEPIARYAKLRSKEATIHQDKDLGKTTVFQSGLDIPGLFDSQYMSARFGRLPTDSYRKLSFYEDEPFMLHPIQTDEEYIWLIYLTSLPDKEEIDAIFNDLYFERVFIPPENMTSAEAAEEFIRKCIDVGGTPDEVTPHEKYGSVKRAKRRTTYNHMFPDGFGAFFIETFFEMFEVLLSFISNTMSFLRVGGFILIHAGMMSVVFTLSEMVGGGGSVFVIIGGNLFVMALEGLIVGIQCLRLEFYEMFSRFFEAGGDVFQPAAVNYSQAAVN